MSRGPRELSEYGIYHVILRGNGRKTLFEDDDDCRFFLKILGKTREKFGFKLYAFCLMNNHVNLMIYEGKATLEQIFRKVATTYALYYNGKYGSTGHLFQGRYKSEIIDRESYFFNCMRYICQNPVKAGICEDPRKYPWLGIAGIWDRGLETDHVKELNGYDDAAIGRFMLENCKEKPMEYDDTARMNDREAAKIVRELTGFENLQELSGLGTEEKNAVIEKILCAGISCRQLARITGMSTHLIYKFYRK